MDHQRLTWRTWMTVYPDYFTAGLRTGEKIEVEPLLNGEIRKRIIPAAERNP